MPIPKPHVGENQSVFISRCMGNAVMKREFPDQKQRAGVCHSQWRGKGKNHAILDRGETMENEIKHIEFVAPIHIESAGDEADSPFIISGTAIEETISRNKMQYKAEELQKAVETLVDVPLLKDHNNSVDSVVGRVREAKFKEGKIGFKAEIMDDSMKDKIQKGLIKHVSIGSEIKKITSKVTNGIRHLVANGIEFLELSLVAVPGVLNATFAQAIEAYARKLDEEDKMEEDKMAKLESQLAELKELLIKKEQDDPPKEEPKKEPEKTPEEKPEEKPDDSEEKLKEFKKEMVKLKEDLSNITVELAKSKSKASEKVENSPYYASEVVKDQFGNYCREWNYGQWENHAYA